MNSANENDEKILAIFHNKCEELGLWYSLSNLSLLKTKSDAVKNDNNIVEVMMKIEDYNQFLKVNHDHLIDNLGGLKGVLTAIGAIVTKVFANQLSYGLTNIVYNVKMLTKAGREAEQANRKKVIDDAIESIPKSKEFST